MFGEIVSPVGIARLPENMKLALAIAITEPVESYVHSLGAFLFDHVIDDPTGGVVVSLQRCGRLRMTQFFQSSVDGAEVLWALRNKVPNSASAALETTCCMIWQRTWMGGHCQVGRVSGSRW